MYRYPDPSSMTVYRNVQQSTTQFDFQNITDGDGLTCILPPDGGDFWPFGGNPTTPTTPTTGQSSPSKGAGLSGGAKAGIAIAVIVGVILIAAAVWFIRRAALARAKPKEMPWDRVRYAGSKEDVTPRSANL